MKRGAANILQTHQGRCVATGTSQPEGLQCLQQQLSTGRHPTNATGLQRSDSVKWGHQVGPEALDPPDEVTQKREPSLTELKAQLERWRSDLAQRQNARSSSILSNAAIDEILNALPRSRRELKSLRSIQPNQWRKHWKEILQIIDDAFSAASTGPASMDSAIGKDQSLSAESADSLPEAVHRHFNISVSA